MQYYISIDFNILFDTNIDNSSKAQHWLVNSLMKKSKLKKLKINLLDFYTDENEPLKYVCWCCLYGFIDIDNNSTFIKLVENEFKNKKYPIKIIEYSAEIKENNNNGKRCI